MKKENFAFDDVSIEKLFGNEAADYEDINRLKDYYFKGKQYSRVTADVPLRILVGHKGIGKSALIRYAMHEDLMSGILPVLIKPDDVVGIAKTNVDFLLRINDWKDGLHQVIGKKVLDEFYIGDAAALQLVTQPGGRFLNMLQECIAGLLNKTGVNLSTAKDALARKFLEKKKLGYISTIWIVAGLQEKMRLIEFLHCLALFLTLAWSFLVYNLESRCDQMFTFCAERQMNQRTKQKDLWFGFHGQIMKFWLYWQKELKPTLKEAPLKT